jgi:hypothetical protein
MHQTNHRRLSDHLCAVPAVKLEWGHSRFDPKLIPHCSINPER